MSSSSGLLSCKRREGGENEKDVLTGEEAEKKEGAADWEKDLEDVRFGIAVKGFQKVVELLNLQPGMTGPEVQAHVKELTKATKLSALKHMKEGGGDFSEVAAYIKDPTIFLSHCWQFTLQDIMESLEELDEDEVVWFDLFTVPQNEDPSKPPKPFSWWSSTFFKNVERIGKVVMVMKPITKPITLTRAWCVFELYACIATKSGFDVAMPAQVRESFLALIRDDHRSFFKTISSVETRKCEAGQPQDKENIARVIAGAGGFGEIDQMVIERLKEWFVRVLEDQVKTSDIVERAAYRHSLGAMCREDGKYDDAEEQLKLALEERKATLGEDHPDTLWTKAWLGQAYSFMWKQKESVAILVECLQKQKEVLGEDHEHTIFTACELGANYGVYLNRFDEGEEMLEDCLERAKRVLGEEHAQTLIIMNNLALTYATSGKADEAKELYLECIERCKEKLGEGHPETLMTMFNLGLFYKAQRAYKEAEAIYYECFQVESAICLGLCYTMSGTDLGTLHGVQRQREVLGANHDMTLRVMLGLGTVYCEDDEKLEEARQVAYRPTPLLYWLFEDCLQRMAATKHQEERICRNWLRDCQIRLRMLAPKADVKTEEEEGEESVGEGGSGGGEEERAGEGESE